MRLETWGPGRSPSRAQGIGGLRRAALAEGPGTLAQRVRFGVAVAVPVLAGAYLGGPWFLLGATLLGYLGLRELYALAARSGARLVPVLGYTLGFGVLLANGGAELLRPLLTSIPAGAMPQPDGNTVALSVRFAVVAVVVLPLVALLFERGPAAGQAAVPSEGAESQLTGRLIGWALTVAGTLYVAWLVSHFQLLRLVGAGAAGGVPGEAGRGWVFFVFAATWSYDTGAYLVGRRFGRHRFMTWISPKKTWEGAAGGLAACLLVTLIARSPVPAALAALTGWAPLPVPLWHVPLLALAICVAAQLGDLAESLIKREAGAKDASDLIPGHGGMLDRMDSLLFTIVLIYYYAALVLGLG